MFTVSEQQLKDFITESYHDIIILDIIGHDNRCHSAMDKPLAVFIRNVDKDITVCASVNHYDSIHSISFDVISNLIRSHSNKTFVFDKKRISHFIPDNDFLDIQIIEYLNSGEIIDISKFESPVFSEYNTNGHVINNIIPISMHLSKFDALCDSVILKTKTFRTTGEFEFLNDLTTNTFYNIEKAGIKTDIDKFNTHFQNRNDSINNTFVYSEYNLFTATGRPSNRHNKVNYSALNKESHCKEAFISRFDGGKLILIDYSAYHPHLIAKLINYNLPTNAYEYLGQHYFQKKVLTELEIKESKSITFKLLYGHSMQEYADIPFFKKIQDYINHRWDFFIKNAYVETPLFKRHITTNNIKDATPSKLFNYILQAYETECNVFIINDILNSLQGCKSKLIIYTYDSFLFDISPDELHIVDSLKNIISNLTFPIKTYIGDNYDKMIISV